MYHPMTASFYARTPAPAPRRIPTTADRAREAVLALGGGRGVVKSHVESAWAAITFSGTRHELVLRFEGIEAVEAGELLIERLPDHEFSISGQLVADATVTKVEHVFGPVEWLEVTAVLLLLEES
jgi:hypothetical protein